MPPNPVQITNITHAGVIAALDELATGMGVDTTTDGPADAGMTFFGQFVEVLGCRGRSLKVFDLVQEQFVLQFSLWRMLGGNSDAMW